MKAFVRLVSLMVVILVFFSTSTGPLLGLAHAAIPTIDRDSLLTDTVEYVPNQGCTGSGPATSGTGTDLENFMKITAWHESGGNPKAGNVAGGAWGKYQIINTTWHGWAKRSYPPADAFPSALDAPEAVQDALMYVEYTKELKSVGGDVWKLFVSHYYPLALSDPSKLDIIPAPEAGNTATPREYADGQVKLLKDTTAAWTKIQLHYTEAPDFASWLDKAGGAPAGATTNTGTTGSSQKTYVLGDSIIDWFANANPANAAKYGIDAGQLQKALTDKSITPTISALGGRQLSGAHYTGPDGNAQIEADQATITDADSVVIALGTNRNDPWGDNTKDSFNASVTKAITRIKQLNKNHDNAKIFWVNLASVGAPINQDAPGNYPYDQSIKDYNDTLSSLATSQKFSVLDWATLVSQNQAYIGTGYAGLDGYLHVHPSVEGTKAYVNMIVNGLTGTAGATTAANGTAGCDGTTPATAGGTAASLTLDYNDTSRNRKLTTTVWLPAGNGPFPVVMFAHGWEAGPDVYKRFTQSLASQGFIVVAPSFTNADGKGVLPLNRPDSLPKQPADLKFVLDQILKEPQLQGKIKTDAIAVVGHSDGAIDALRVGYSGEKDSRYKAVVEISADDISGDLGSGPPLLAIHGDADKTASYPGDHNNFAKISATPKYWATLIGADHMPPVADQTPYAAGLDKLTGTFLKNILNGEQTDLAALVQQYNQQLKLETQ